MKDLGEYLNLVRRRWPIIIAAVVFASAAAWAVTPPPDSPEAERHEAYVATHVLYLDPGANSPVSLDAMAFFATTGEIPQRVIDRLGETEEPALLAAQVTVTADSELGTLSVATTQPDPERAVELAQAFAEETVAHFDEQERLREEEAMETTLARIAAQEDQIRELSRQIADLPEGDVDAVLLQAELDALVRQYSMNLDGYESLQDQPTTGIGLYPLQEAVAVPVVEEGEVFTPPQSRGTRMAIAGAVGFVLAVLLIIVVDRVDTRVRTRQSAEVAFHLPVVSEIPRLSLWERRRQPVVSDPASTSAEGYRALRLSLQLMPRWVLSAPDPGTGAEGASLEKGADQRHVEGAPQVILMTSPRSGEGKTTTAVNLAASFAEIGRSVLVLDCDLQQPTLHRDLQVPSVPGVTDYLASADRPPLSSLTKPTPIPGVRVLASGSPRINPGDLLGRMGELLTEARRAADVVVIDSPPLLQSSGSVALAPLADAVIVVARSGRTSADAAQRTREMLARISAQVLGVVLVAVPRWAVQQPYRRMGKGGDREGVLKWPSALVRVDKKDED